MQRRATGLVAGSMLALALGTTAALAMPESCQKDFVPLMDKRQKYINTINGYQKRKPTAAQACSTFRGLADHNQKIAKWMTAQKEWCQIPDDMLKGVTDAQGQISQTRDNVCSAAAKQAKQIQQMKAQAAQQQQGRQPGVGSGVRLPAGAL
ncbi:MAG: hypothetical protein LCH61_13355 [Proteobacteria bacterium]|nr:hypothetical protein [Pseudomonadota bacterium]